MLRGISGVAAIAACIFTMFGAFAGDGYRFLQIDGHDVKWGAPRLGTGATVTYAVAEKPNARVGTINCRRTASTKQLLTASKITAAQFDRALVSALGAWEEAADIRFVPVNSMSAANLVIAAEADDDGIAYTDVTPTSDQGTGVNSITRGIVCLNPHKSWFPANSRQTVSPAKRKTYSLKYVLTHEIGHALGLDHPSPRGELMSFEYGPAIDRLQPGDIAGIVALYGISHAKAAIALNNASPSAP